MRAIVFKAVGEPLAIESLADPEPGEGEMVIKVARCGVCGTDLHSTSGHGMTLPPGSQLGHEYAGEVIAIGKGVERFRIGDKLAAIPVVGCGQCEGCKTGIDIFCANFIPYGSGLAEFAKVNERGATRLPDTVSLADGALIEPLAVGARAVRLANLNKDAKVLIIGPGPIGMSVLFWLRQSGVENVVMLASSERRRDLAATMGGSKFLVEGDGTADEIHAVLGGLPDIVFEAAGVPGVMGRAIELVRPQGMVIALGFCLQPDPIVPGMALMKDLTIRWSITYSREDYSACVDALDRDGELAGRMVTDVASLDDAPAAFEAFRAGKGGGGKLLIDPWA